jgi:thioredoxin 1
VDDNPDLAGKYGVMSIPTFIIFKNGEIVGTSIGSVSKNTLIEKIQKAIE